jgi:hypothetical protein
MRTARTLGLLLAVAALALVLESVAVILLGASAPAWSHWLCSPSSIHSARHALLSGGLGNTLKVSLQLLAVHWPHLLPIPLGVTMLIYLHRANARYNQSNHAGRPVLATSPHSSS